MPVNRSHVDSRFTQDPQTVRPLFHALDPPLTSIRPTIKFTMELEEEGSLPFLDTRVIRLANGKLDITVYLKSTFNCVY